MHSDDLIAKRCGYLLYCRYTDILNGIPEPIQDEWHFKKILNKLAKYGLVSVVKRNWKTSTEIIFF